MHRSRRIFAFSIAFCLLLSRGLAQQWPLEPFDRVVAYCYDYSQDSKDTLIIQPDGSLHKGIIKSTTLRLGRDQIKELRTILSTDSKEEIGVMECFDPHHAFVFYDKDWNVTASISVCFACEGYAARPKKGVSKIVNLRKLEAFSRRLGLPVLETDKEYTDLWLKEQPNEELKAEAKKENDDDPFGD